MIRVRTVKGIITEHKKLEKDIAEIEDSLRSVRKAHDGDWEKDITKDERKPIQILYKELVALRIELTNLGAGYAGLMTEEDIKCMQIGRQHDVRIQLTEGLTI